METNSAVDQNHITFIDITTDVSAGLDYTRAESARNAIFDQLRQQPVYTLPEDLLSTPMFARGVPGVAILDYDDDGDLDLYVTNGPDAANSLYSNQLAETGQLTFVDVAQAAGVSATDQDSNGVAYGDIDNDGDHDLLVLGSGESNRLFENQGDGTFIDITETSGIGGGSRYSISASMGDVNGDGLLDIVVANAFNLDNQVPIVAEPFALNEHNQLFLNTGNNTFVDVSATSGIESLTGFSEGAPEGAATITWAIAMVDYDLDGDLDIIQADDQAAFPPAAFGGIDRGFIHILQNDGSASFTDVTVEANLSTETNPRSFGAWMGLSFGDFNADGNLDIFGSNFGDYGVGDFFGDLTFNSRWFLGQDDGTFIDPGVGELGITPFGWGTSATDYDNDGDTDIIFQGGLEALLFTGVGVDASNPGAILNNDGNANFSFDANALATAADHTRRSDKGAAVGDLNNDGFVDVVSVSNFDFPEPTPLVPYGNFGSPFDETAFFVPTFIPTDEPGVFVSSDFELPDGTLAVEINSADNGNSWVAVEVMGTVGLTTAGRANRDGIGAVVLFTPEDGDTAMQPILGGSSFASQDSLAANFGLGSESSGTVEVLWSGGVRNRLYDVEEFEQVVFPEIPVSFEGDFDSLQEYEVLVGDAIDELVALEVLTVNDGERFFSSAVRAFIETQGERDDVLVGTPDVDELVGSSADETLYALAGDDTVAGGLGDDILFGGEGEDVLRGDRNRRSSGGVVGGDDTIFGGLGNDRMGGKGGNDELYGDEGDDRIWGDDGNDILSGGLGNDTLIGGRGQDTFLLAQSEDTDTIGDFTIGEDLIGLTGLISFDQLSITQDGSNTLIGFEEQILAVLNNVNVSELTIASFTTF